MCTGTYFSCTTRSACLLCSSGGSPFHNIIIQMTFRPPYRVCHFASRSSIILWYYHGMIMIDVTYILICLPTYRTVRLCVCYCYLHFLADNWPVLHAVSGTQGAIRNLWKLTHSFKSAVLLLTPTMLK